MRKLATAAILVMAMILAACGTTSNGAPANINGNWTATLNGSNGTAELSFQTSIIVNSDGTLSISNFTFTSNSSCFVSGESESGSFGLSGNFNGNVTGTFGLTVKSGTPAGNTLTLNGTVSGNTISGTWSLTGSGGCTGSGNFVMTQM